MSNELVVIQKENAIDLFTNKEKIESLLDDLESKLNDFDHDMSTGVSRKRTASFAMAFAKTKTYIDGEGKKLVDDLKKLPKEIDATRKICRDRLDEMKVKARQPLTEWENEQAEIKAEQDRQDLIKIIDSDFEDAHAMMLAYFEKKRLDEAARKEAEEKTRIEYEERIEREAKERADREAQEKIEAEKLRHEREIEAAKQREVMAAEREEEMKRQAVLAEEKRLRDIEIAKQQEIERQRLEKERIDREAAQREANNRHVGQVRKLVKESIMSCGVDEETAKRIVMAIHKGEVPNVKINY